MMDSYSEKLGESSRNAAGEYMNYAIAAQHELFQLGVNLFQRQVDTGRKIAASRDLGQAVGAWTDFAKHTVEDFSAATTRLLEQASAASSTMVQRAEEGFRTSAEQAKRAGEAATGQR